MHLGSSAQCLASTSLKFTSAHTLLHIIQHCAESVSSMPIGILLDGPADRFSAKTSCSPWGRPGGVCGMSGESKALQMRQGEPQGRCKGRPASVGDWWTGSLSDRFAKEGDTGHTAGRQQGSCFHQEGSWHSPEGSEQGRNEVHSLRVSQGRRTSLSWVSVVTTHWGGWQGPLLPLRSSDPEQITPPGALIPPSAE